MAATCIPTRNFGAYTSPYDTLSTGYGYPTGTGYYGYPTGFEMPSKYASIFNKDMPSTVCPPTSTVCPPTPAGYFNTPMNYYNTLFNTPVNTVCPPFVNPMSYYYNNYMSRPYSSTFSPSMFYNNFYNMPYNMPSEVYFRNFLPSTFTGGYGSSLYNINFRPTSSIEFYTLTNPIRVLDREGNRQLFLCFDLKGYKPEEINVTLNKTERCVVVEATHEAKDGKEHHVMRKFYRKFVLPETLAKVDISKCELKSCFTPEGLLIVECFLPKMTVEEIAKCPIMSKAFTTPYGFESVFGCPSTCNTAPINCKIN